MADKTYLVRGYYPGIGFRYWYSSSSSDLFLDYPTPDAYYPADTATYQDVILIDIVVAGSGGVSDGYSLIDQNQVANFTDTIVAGEPLVLTSSGLEKAKSDVNDTVYGLSAISGSVTSGVTIIPVIVAGMCDTGDLGPSSAGWSIGDALYLATTAMGEAGVTNDVVTLGATAGVNIIKLGTWSNVNVITVSISFVLYTG